MKDNKPPGKDNPKGRSNGDVEDLRDSRGAQWRDEQDGGAQTGGLALRCLPVARTHGGP
jgi:hypothetical protein